jgi:transcriptional regulator with XRE-family HTH domain
LKTGGNKVSIREPGSEYARLSARYRQKLSDLMDQEGQKKLASGAGISPQAVSSWKTRGSLPDVVVGCMIAREGRVTADSMVFDEALKYFHRSPVIKEIVEILELYADDESLLIEIRGIVKRHLSDYTLDHPEREEIEA